LVLIIEGNEDDLAVTGRVLSACAPTVRLRQVCTSEEAIAVLQESTVRLILIDMYLPNCSGLEVLEDLSHIAAMNGIPVVITTTGSPDWDVRRAYELGARSVLIKPDDYDEYRDMLRTACVFWLEMNLSIHDQRVRRSH
jgi:CheY-like chemotaxis protein